ncbi:hypothetical protein NBM05_01875 [Rothia sp. AR01]|uniref:Uncharacterized protein n=1 Tax=Rothia santali TaxID=2949643 RepID=A0A9X2KHE5_9MICC|nr:hypothetical protein [Rothia santali]MCP3424810.1 hypothetical protein [Rothia santali]
MSDLVPACLSPGDAAAYGRWLGGGQEPVPWSWEDDGSLACLLAPAPWSFWIGVGAVTDGMLRPVLVFKNPVPVMDDRLLGDEPPRRIDEQLRRRLEHRLRVHNPGLQGALERLRAEPVGRLIERSGALDGTGEVSGESWR